MIHYYYLSDVFLKFRSKGVNVFDILFLQDSDKCYKSNG